MNRTQLQRHLEQRLRDAGIESATAEARWLLEHVLSVTTEHTIKNQQGGFSPLQNLNIEISAAHLELLELWTQRRLKREPLQHILGVAPFYGLELQVTPDVLVPRPETERLVELVLEYVKPLQKPKILDIGTGSGAIAVAIKHERPNANVIASDISSKALAIAKENAKKYDLEVTWLESDLLEQPEVRDFAKTCDVLVANLPYLPEGDKATVSPEVLHDPDLALYGGKDGLELFRKLEQQAFDIVKKGCLCFFELDPRNVERAVSQNLWQQTNIHKDFVGRQRFLHLLR
ncbi:MAG: peptide chain release factor N(5)-glutamine methyltransferase [Trueperaceae bacterium]